MATINNAGNAQFNGTLQVDGTSTFIGTPTVKNQLDAEIDAVLWAGLTTSQKESFMYKDWNGNSQWYMVKDQAITGRLTPRRAGWTASRPTKAPTAATLTSMPRMLREWFASIMKLGRVRASKFTEATAALCMQALRGRLRSCFQGWLRAAGISACRSITRDT